LHIETTEEKKMNQQKKDVRTYLLGDLIAELWEASNEVTSHPVEQKLLVYAALMDLLGNKKSRAVAEA
jgi:hypothetical protein